MGRSTGSQVPTHPTVPCQTFNTQLTVTVEISKSRDNAWSVVSSRKHTLSKAFAGHAETEELVLFGSVQMVLSKGETNDHPFVAHVTVGSGPSGSEPRISNMEVYAVGLTCPGLPE